MGRMNEYLSGAWPCSCRVPDEVINNLPEERVSYDIPTYAIKASFLVAFLNTIMTKAPFQRKNSLKVLWTAESRCAADMGLFRGLLDVYQEILDEYAVPPGTFLWVSELTTF